MLVPMIDIVDRGRPPVSGFFPKGHRWGGKRRVVERPNRKPKSRGACLPGPANGDPAGRAEMMVDTSPGVTRPSIDVVGTIESDGFPWKIRVAGPRHARAALAARQWHTFTIVGSAETATLKAPHRHLAVLGIFAVSPDGRSDPDSTRARPLRKPASVARMKRSARALKAGRVVGLGHRRIAERVARRVQRPRTPDASPKIHGREYELAGGTPN